MVVDVHTHYLPERYLSAVSEIETAVGPIERGDGTYISHPHDTFPLFSGFTDLEERIEWMDTHGIDVGLLSNSKPNPNDEIFTPEQAVTLSQTLNDGLAAARDAYPDRVNGLGVLPLRDVESALAELDRIMLDLDLAGVGIHTTVAGKKLSAPEFEPVFDRIEELGTGVFLHPGYNRLAEGLDEDEWVFNPLVMFPTETTMQVARLIFDGFFDRHQFPLVIAHLGGALPYLAGRIDLGRTIGEQRFGDDAFSTPAEPMETYLQRFNYDAIIHHPQAMRCAVETVGAESILFGTDYPFESEDVRDVYDDIDAVTSSDAQSAGMFDGNARQVFDL